MNIAIDDLSNVFLLAALAIFLVSALLWVFMGKKMVAVVDFLHRPNISLASTLLFLLGVGLVGLDLPLPELPRRIVGLSLMMFYLAPALFRISALLSGGIDKHRPRVEQPLPPPKPPAELL